MIEILKDILKTAGWFAELGWTKRRIEKAVTHELFRELLRYHEGMMKKKYDKDLSLTIDALRSIIERRHSK